MAFITNDKDRKVKVFNDDVVVSSSNAQSEYARFLNFKENFTITENTLSGDKVYDIVGLGYAIPQEGGTAPGTVNRPLNFNEDHFDIVEVVGSPGSYDIDSTGRVKVNDLATIRQLRITNSGTDDAVTVTDDSGNDEIDLVYKNDQAAVFVDGVQVGSRGRRLNFIGGSVTEDSTSNNRFDITAGLPVPTGKKYGSMVGPQNLEDGGTIDVNGFPAGDGLLNIPYVTIGSGNKVQGGYDTTNGVFRRYILGSDDNDAIKILSGSEITNRSANPHIYGKMRINVLEDHRFFLGWHTGTIPDGDDNFLDNLIGFGIGQQSDLGATPNTHWQIIRNDGDATADKVSTGIAIAASTVFSFELFGDATNSRWSWKVNGGSYTNYTTEVPTTQNLNFTFQFEEIAGDEASIDLFYLYWLQDK
jgi:hypothetical protein